MKKNLLFTTFILIYSFVLAQTINSEKQYFERNISNLDPIEGIYEVHPENA